MSQYEDQEEVQTREWEEALSIIENIFKDYKEKGSTNKTVPKTDPLALDVARWKVVWGKKPAQYRLKPFLMWSVDEMPSIPEECGSSPEPVDNSKEPIDTQKMKNDRKLRLMRKKIFKMNRRVDEINVLLVHAAAEDARNHGSDENGNGTGGILTESTRAELVIERNIVLDKLRKTKRKLIAMKNAGADQKKLSLLGLEEPIVKHRAEPFSEDNHSGLAVNFDQEVDCDSLNFKHGRRSAIKKEIRSTVFNKMMNNALKENSSRRSESLDVEEKKNKKKKFCRKHHKKMQDKNGLQSCENEMLLGRRTLSEHDFSRVVKELNERGQLKIEAIEGGEKDKIMKSAQLRNGSMERIPAMVSSKESRGFGPPKPGQQGVQTELATGPAKWPRSKKSEFCPAIGKSDKESPGCPSSQGCAQVNGNQGKTKRDKVLKVSLEGIGDSLMDAKRAPEPGKQPPKVKKSPPSGTRETRVKPNAKSKLENKELATKVRPQKIAEAAVKLES